MLMKKKNVYEYIYMCENIHIYKAIDRKIINNKS